ncbi:MAG: hypothetical protein WCK02_01295 [Bacteroidota bacterium]
MSVSRKYEADDGCIGINGDNLCLLQNYWTASAIVLLLIMVVIFIKGKKVFSSQKELNDYL